MKLTPLVTFSLAGVTMRVMFLFCTFLAIWALVLRRVLAACILISLSFSLTKLYRSTSAQMSEISTDDTMWKKTICCHQIKLYTSGLFCACNSIFFFLIFRYLLKEKKDLSLSSNLFGGVRSVRSSVRSFRRIWLSNSCFSTRILCCSSVEYGGKLSYIKILMLSCKTRC